MEVIINWEQPVVFSYRQGKKPLVAFEVKNTSAQPLYVAMLWLGARFGIEPRLMPGDRLVSNQAKNLSYIEINTTKTIFDLSINPELEEQGIKEQTDYIKIIVSTQPFSMLHFQQESLSHSHKMQRGAEPDGAIMVPDWAGFLLPIQIKKE